MPLPLAIPRLTFPVASDTCAGWAAPRSDYETAPWGRDRAQPRVKQWLCGGGGQGQGKASVAQAMLFCQAVEGHKDPAETQYGYLTVEYHWISIPSSLISPTSY